MITLRLWWLILALWHMSGTAPYLVSAQMNSGWFKLVNGGRYGDGAHATRPAASLADCAIMCLQENSCSDFNFGSGQCELLPATVYGTCGAAPIPGWTHGNNLKGKQQQQNNVCSLVSNIK